MCMPLNSSCITAGQLHLLCTALEITSSGSIDDQRLIVEWKISELGHEPCNVQVIYLKSIQVMPASSCVTKAVNF